MFAWVESTALNQWLLGSVYAFPAMLSLHAIGMGVAAGLGALLALRVLGVGRGVPLAELERFMPVLWAGFAINLASGVALLIAYPTKALTNPVFYLKIGLIVTALVLIARMARRVFAHDTAQIRDDEVAAPLRPLAIASLVCWAGAIVAGRLLAYTYWYLTAADY